MTDQHLDILAIAPHPDDAEIACGGSLALARQKGLGVAILDLTRGEASSRGDPLRRRREAEEAALRLGGIHRYGLDLPDTRLGTEPGHAEAIVPLLRRLRPRILLIPDGVDRHPDHAAASALARRAVFLAGLARHGDGLPHRVDMVAAYAIHHPVTPSFVIDVSAVWPQRMHALAAYASQFGDGEGPATPLQGGDFLRAIEARAISHGALIGARYGEAFRLDGPVGLAGLEALLQPRTSAYRMVL